TQVAEGRWEVSGNAIVATNFRSRDKRQRVPPPGFGRGNVGEPHLRVVLHANGFAESAVAVAAHAQVDTYLIAEANVRLGVDALVNDFKIYLLAGFRGRIGDVACAIPDVGAYIRYLPVFAPEQLPTHGGDEGKVAHFGAVLAVELQGEAPVLPLAVADASAV